MGGLAGETMLAQIFCPLPENGFRCPWTWLSTPEQHPQVGAKDMTQLPLYTTFTYLNSLQGKNKTKLQRARSSPDRL